MEATPDYNFTVTPSGSHHLVKYKKSPVSARIMGSLLFYTFIPAIALTIIINKPSSVGEFFIWFVVINFILVFAIYQIINKIRGTGEFLVSKDNIVFNGKTYDYKHVSSIGIKDASNKYVESAVVVYGQFPTVSLATGMANVSNAMATGAAQTRQEIQHVMKQVGYKVFIRFGSKDINIASGLDEAAADILHEKVCELAGFGNSVKQ